MALEAHGWRRKLVAEADGPASEVRGAMDAAAEYVGTYVALRAQIKGLQEQADEAKEAVVALLQGATGTEWVYPGLATVAIVKGRTNEKLDRAKLAAAGVDPKVLDAATVRSEGKPSMRITADGGEQEGK